MVLGWLVSLGGIGISGSLFFWGGPDEDLGLVSLPVVNKYGVALVKVPWWN